MGKGGVGGSSDASDCPGAMPGNIQNARAVLAEAVADNAGQRERLARRGERRELWCMASASWTRRQTSASPWALGPRKFAFRRQHLSKRDRNSLITFCEGIQGAWQSFTYNAPNAHQTTT